jgi:hypothetical protein
MKSRWLDDMTPMAFDASITAEVLPEVVRWMGLRRQERFAEVPCRSGESCRDRKAELG